jgi:hypothetical protein
MKPTTTVREGEAGKGETTEREREKRREEEAKIEEGCLCLRR